MRSRRIGYARVSTEDQSLDLQVDALRAANCDRIYQDHGLSGALRVRPALDEALAALRPGDVLVVWKLDRLGRSVKHLVDILDGLSAQEVEFESLTEALDTKSALGEALFQIVAVLAQLERRMIAERTKSGLAAARRRGVRLGRRPLLDARQASAVRRQLKDGTASAAMLAERYGVSTMTIYRATK